MCIIKLIQLNLKYKKLHADGVVPISLEILQKNRKLWNKTIDVKKLIDGMQHAGIRPNSALILQH